MEVKVTAQNFQEEVINSPLPVLVDFWAPWCGPCKMIAPYLEELAEKYDGKIKVAKINVDEAAELATQFAIMSIPALLIFKDGKVMEKTTGVMSKEELERFISSYIA
ncbi:MAG: thioredoxin [Candidatus Omnitrophota bacterium]|nr:MAG: thioredoxin [Candidatus Omnitrophota bacterium]